MSTTTPVSPPPTVAGAPRPAPRTTPGGRGRTHLRTPPPRTRQPLPSLAPGDRVALACSDGEYRGVVVEGPDGFVRLRDGAGWWHIDRREILGVTQLAPVAARVPDEAAERHAHARRVDRILQRWP